MRLPRTAISCLLFLAMVEAHAQAPWQVVARNSLRNQMAALRNLSPDKKLTYDCEEGTSPILSGNLMHDGVIRVRSVKFDAGRAQITAERILVTYFIQAREINPLLTNTKVNVEIKCTKSELDFIRALARVFLLGDELKARLVNYFRAAENEAAAKRIGQPIGFLEDGRPFSSQTVPS